MQSRPSCRYAVGDHATSPDFRYDAAAFLLNCDTGSIESDEFIFIRKHSNREYDLQDLTWIPVGGIGANDAGPLIRWEGPTELSVKFYQKMPLIIAKEFQSKNKILNLSINQEYSITRYEYNFQKYKRIHYENDSNVLNLFWMNKLGITALQ
ncbi:hypothetical protein [Novosphingobium cyanobacteriorum]|uniref:Uncharacterized protein n=1 Tax=Novosphingobium cyanobacteriorum TaxID=3024215 RepID=A0ABT6CF84_9SPHN|nr:hypothetical protein [Novosphingobium cyanobacteriorum]MDF8332575.1 hypothetical protein [Novosphingobium cyanobacteriorum]